MSYTEPGPPAERSERFAAGGRSAPEMPGRAPEPRRLDYGRHADLCEEEPLGSGHLLSRPAHCTQGLPRGSLTVVPTAGESQYGWRDQVGMGTEGPLCWYTGVDARKGHVANPPHTAYLPTAPARARSGIWRRGAGRRSGQDRVHRGSRALPRIP